MVTSSREPVRIFVHKTPNDMTTPSMSSNLINSPARKAREYISAIPAVFFFLSLGIFPNHLLISANFGNMIPANPPLLASGQGEFPERYRCLHFQVVIERIPRSSAAGRVHSLTQMQLPTTLLLKEHVKSGLERIPVLCTSSYRLINRFSWNAHGRNSLEEKMLANIMECGERQLLPNVL